MRKKPQITPMKPLKALTEKQKEYIRAIVECKIIFCIGATGSGKSYVSVLKSLEELLRGSIDKIIITRPTQEISSRGLGYLKGTLDEKYASFIKPVEQIILSAVPKSLYNELIAMEKIVFEPLEYMVGMTFPKRSIAILDEAENCDLKQLRMFLTRMGGGRLIINGDEKQTYKYVVPPLSYVIDALDDLDDVAVIRFLPQDIVRDQLLGIICERIDKIVI